MRNNRRMHLRESVKFNPDELLDLGFKISRDDRDMCEYIISFGKYGDLVLSCFLSGSGSVSVDVKGFPFHESMLSLDRLHSLDEVEDTIAEYESMDGVDFCASILEKELGFYRLGKYTCVKEGTLNIKSELVSDRFDGYGKIVVDLKKLTASITQTSSISGSNVYYSAIRIK